LIEKIQAKILSWEQAQKKTAAWKANKERIVFTNGCFDLLHFGHLHYLAEARELGDRLVIGLNSEDSVRRLKGPNRPINDEKTREFQLASLEFVDAVVVFEQDTPIDLIKLLQPDILVKGGDWKASQIVGSDVVLSNGGTVKNLPFIEGYSTTLIEQKIKNQRS
jgi:rfaE bifunctional protein nucleotidyltransferase chain/domain